jgi:hypothetical protein
LTMVSMIAAGVMTQQLANEPRASFDDGRFTRLAPRLFEMFTTYFAPVR